MSAVEWPPIKPGQTTLRVVIEGIAGTYHPDARDVFSVGGVWMRRDAPGIVSAEVVEPKQPPWRDGDAVWLTPPGVLLVGMEEDFGMTWRVATDPGITRSTRYVERAVENGDATVVVRGGQRVQP